MTKHQRIATAILLVLLAGSPLSAAVPGLQFLSNVDQVTAHNVTPRGDVLFLSTSRERVDWTSQVTSRLDFVTAHPKGFAVLDGVSVVDPSIWAVVDLKTSGFTVTSPSDQYHAVAVEESGLVGGTGFVYAGERLDLVVIRGQNAWLARVHDGGAADHSLAQDGQVQIDFDALQRVYPSASFVTYGSPQNGDLLIGIDAAAMVWFTTTVTGSGTFDP